jgi:hypothetical protein
MHRLILIDVRGGARELEALNYLLTSKVTMICNPHK